MKILILKPSSLGDVVQAIPVLRMLKRHLPDSTIYWWIESKLAPLLEGDPDLAGIVRFDRQRWAEPRQALAFWRGLRWMRSQTFDWVIDLQCLIRSGFVAWLANGKTTIGLDEPREGARGVYDIIAQRQSFHTHAVDWYLEVLRLLNVPVRWDFQWLPERPEIAAAVRRKWPVDAAKWLVIQPGARRLNKRWPAEYFASLVRQLAAAHADFRFAILGTRNEQPLGEIIARVDPRRCLDLTGQVSLPEMVEWIRLGELVVSNDTGPMHVAAALGKPVVALFGPTEPRRTGPYGQIDHTLQLDLPCIPCLKHGCASRNPLECLQALPVTTVFQAVQKRLGSLAR